MAKRKIYLDYASTTPVDPRVFGVMKPYFSQKFGNPASLHSFGREASEAVEKARKLAADFFGCESGEIIFTSGATESNNFALKGAIIARVSHFSAKRIKPHIITTQFEHSCVLNSCKKLEEQGMAEVTYLPIGKDGLVSVNELKKNIKPNTALVSIMYANNEIGTIQPLREIGKLIAKENASREEKPARNASLSDAGGILFHTDAVQAVNYLDCKVDNLGVDLLTASGHKIYGPKGVGLLYIREETPLKRIQDGGEHESGLRAGTLNVSGIVGFGKALEITQQERVRNYKIVEKLRDHMFSRVMNEIKGARINGSKIKRIPNNANFLFRDVEGEGLLLGLDLEGIAVSTGSACSSGDLRPSHVLTAIGISEEESHGSLRVTLGKYTTKQEVDYFIDNLKEVILRLRKIAGK